MIFRTMLFSVAAAVTVSLPVFAHCYEYDQEATTRIVMEMIVDLGGHDAVEKNSGKTMRCTYGGTRKVTVVKKGSTSSFSGDYRNCQEKGSIRDGLYDIVINGDEIIRSVSERSINGKLFDAAMKGDAANVRKLIKAKADVNYTESIPKTGGGYIDGVTPLMSATMVEDLDTVKLLVTNGAWVNYLNSMAVNALWIAANKGNLNIVRYLANHGAYINNSNIEDVTPLMAAAMNSHLDVVKFLVGLKADLDLRHFEGDTALMFALGQRHTDIARFLIDAGANINIRNNSGITALIIAAAEGNEEITKKLLDKKADPTVTTNDGRTALDIARAKGLVGIVKLLEK